MRSNLHLESRDSDLAWKRINHIDHPNRPGWDEMAGIWKAHVEWIDEAGLESDEMFPIQSNEGEPVEPSDIERMRSPEKSRTIEKLVVGWAGTIWVVNVHPFDPGNVKDSTRHRLGSVDPVTMYEYVRFLRRTNSNKQTVYEWIVLYLDYRFIPPVSSLCSRTLHQKRML